MEASKKDWEAFIKKLERRAERIVWNKVFYGKERCRFYFKGICLLESSKGDPWKVNSCHGVCDRFVPRRKEIVE